MKSKSESVKKSKGNGAAKQICASGKFDSSPANSNFPREQMIAEAAYFHAERRGFAPGNEVSDWIQAEADIEGWAGSGQ